MRLRSLLAASVLPLALSITSCSSDPGDGGTCVPGATSMCWCDGVTPGVQACMPNMTFAQCVCDGAAGTDTGTDTGLGVDDDESGSGDTSGSDGDITGPSTGTSTGEAADGADDDTTGGDTMGDECTDERFAHYQACLTLADNSPATDFYAACIQGCPPTTDSCGYSACTIACGLDTPIPPEVQACRDTYAECVYAIISEAKQACYETCTVQREACAEGSICTEAGGSTSACSALHDGCRESCDENGAPSDGWSVANDGVCSGNESLALLYCRLAFSPSSCFSSCVPGAPDCGYQDCLATCQADGFSAEVDCETTWSDCPSTSPACRSQCYADEAACINVCADVSPCTNERNACVAAC